MSDKEIPPIPEGIDYFADMEPIDADPATMETIVMLAEKQLSLEAQVESASEALNLLRNELDTIQMRRLPEVMGALGMKEFTLENGAKITIKEDIKAGITEDNRPAAHAWVRERGDGGIIKNVVSIAFGKDEDAKAEEVVKSLTDQGYSPDQKESIHVSTLKSYVKERLEAGDAIPVDLFGVFEFKKATVKLPKPKATKK